MILSLRNTLAPMALATLALAAAHPVQAQVTTQFDSPITTVFSPSGAETLTLSGMITNLGTAPVTVFDAEVDGFVSDSAGDTINLGFDDFYFDTFVPGSMTPEPLVTAFLSANQAPGFYDIGSGSATGGLPTLTINFSDGSQTNTNFAIDVTTPAAVPEASTTVSFGLLLVFGMGGIVVAARKKKAAV